MNRINMLYGVQFLKLILFLSGLLLLSGVCRPADNQLPPTIAIIVDDLGNHKAMGDRLINIPAPLTLAFLPHRQYSKLQATKAYYSGKEIMLHVPMENTRNLPLGAAGLTSQMSNPELIATFRSALHSVPYISGVNNHMGSALTQNKRAMNILMGELGGYPLYFVDSRTTALSIAHRIADNYNIPALDRDIFLDNAIRTKDIHRQFKKLIALARKKGTAIAIGHPHLRTVRYLERMLPRLGKEGVAVATVKGVWAIRNNAKHMFANSQTVHRSLLAKSGKTTTTSLINHDATNTAADSSSQAL
jgi:uncharacterized protein